MLIRMKLGKKKQYLENENDHFVTIKMIG